MTTPLNRRNWLKAATVMAAGATFASWKTLSAYPADVTRLSPQGHWLPDALVDNASVRLLANENPYGPAPSALRAISETAKMGCYYTDRGLERTYKVTNHVLGRVVQKRGETARDQVAHGRR